MRYQRVIGSGRASWFLPRDLRGQVYGHNLRPYHPAAFDPSSLGQKFWSGKQQRAGSQLPSALAIAADIPNGISATPPTRFPYSAQLNIRPPRALF